MTDTNPETSVMAAKCSPTAQRSREQWWIDGKIAEDVFGRVVEWPSPCAGVTGPHQYTDIIGRVTPRLAPVPPYSSDVAWAWRVVEELASSGIQLDILTHERSYSCTVRGTNIRAEAVTVSEAICRTALAAVGRYVRRPPPERHQRVMLLDTGGVQQYGPDGWVITDPAPRASGA